MSEVIIIASLSKWVNSSIGSIDETLTGTTTSG